METVWPRSITIDQNLYLRFLDWNEDDRIAILLLCETFEQFYFDAVFSRAVYTMTPSICRDGHIERVVFELAMTFGSKIFQIYRVDQSRFMLAD